MFWIGFVVGLVVGSNIGILLYSLRVADEVDD